MKVLPACPWFLRWLLILALGDGGRDTVSLEFNALPGQRTICNKLPRYRMETEAAIPDLDLRRLMIPLPRDETQP